MKEAEIAFILETIKKGDSHNHWNGIESATDVWGGSIAWGYDLTYIPENIPEKDNYLWHDTENVGMGYRAIASFELSEEEVKAKLRKIKRS